LRWENCQPTPNVNVLIPRKRSRSSKSTTSSN
jgi:hypothetical protein